MGSLIQFQDLNLYPELSATAITSPTAAAAVAVAAPRIPKIEPKLEPVDVEPYFSNPNHGFGFNSQPETPISDLNLNSNTGNGSILQSQDNSSDETNVFSEFYRMSEMFRSAFAEHLERYGDVDVMDPNSRAIVRVLDENQLNSIAVSTRRTYQKRSSELVWFTGLGIEDQMCFREAVRKTRMLYDSLRVLAVAEDQKTRGLVQERRSRTRGDLKAAAVMKERDLWLNRVKRVVGSLPGIHIGDLFFFRMELCVVGLHGQAQAGIDYLPGSQSANGEPIATSIIVSGGYEDDEDAGDVIVYTGHGGQDKHNRQCEHQKLEGGNLAMERSMYYGIEIRVIRGFKYEGSASGKVYVYDGLYKIIDSWFDVGKSGFGVYKFKLIRIENQPELGSSVLKFAASLRSKPLVVRPMGYVSLDMSRKKENVPVLFFNDIDSAYDPIYYEYLPSTKFPAFAYHYGGSQTGCDCVAGCFSGCLCAMKNGGEFAYDQNGILVRGKPLVFECGPHCRCPPSCQNRVSQNGVKNRFEVFRSKETGWGVRSLDLIQAGSFICEYAGVALTREQAQIFTMNGDSLVYPNRFAERWAEWGDLSQIFSDYVRPSYPSVPPLDFAVDVSTMRNVACYISHSPSPNVLVQLVLYDHNNISFPHLMLFAMENIPPLRELSLDYGVADEWTGKLIGN